MRRLILTVSYVCLMTGVSYAQNCKVVPTCESLGYDSKVSDCSGKKYLICPFDNSKIFCSDVSDIPTAPSLDDFPGCQELSWTGTEYKCSKCYEGYKINGLDGTCNRNCFLTSTTPPDMSSDLCGGYSSCTVDSAMGATTYYDPVCNCVTGSYLENNQCHEGALHYSFEGTVAMNKSRLVYDDGQFVKMMRYLDSDSNAFCDGKSAMENKNYITTGRGWYTDWYLPSKDELKEILEGSYVEMFRKESLRQGYKDECLTENEVIEANLDWYGMPSYHSYWSSTVSSDGTKQWACSIFANSSTAVCQEYDRDAVSIRALPAYVLKVEKSIVDNKCMKAGGRISSILTCSP